MYRGYNNPFTKYHGHPSTEINFEYSFRTPPSRRRLARCMCFVSRSAGARRDGPLMSGKKRPPSGNPQLGILKNLLVVDFKFILSFSPSLGEDFQFDNLTTV